MDTAYFRCLTLKKYSYDDSVFNNNNNNNIIHMVNSKVVIVTQLHLYK